MSIFLPDSVLFFIYHFIYTMPAGKYVLFVKLVAIKVHTLHTYTHSTFTMQVNRYYTRAKCLNSAETKNLDVKLQSINNTQDEFQRAYSADERLFKMGRRRYISGLQNVSVSSEINYLNDKRRLSSVIPSLDVNLEHLERYQGDNTVSSIYVN